MNRQRLLKQRASRAGIWVTRRDDNPHRWDIVDEGGPRGLDLSRREAVRFAGFIAYRAMKFRVYVTTETGEIHRGSCERVAPSFGVVRKPCRCKWLQNALKKEAS